MPGLLDLPVEIRLLIIQVVIQAQRECPNEYSEDVNRKERRGDRMRSWGEGKGVWYETEPQAYVTSAYGLLSANKQLNQETTPLLANLPAAYNIDIGLMQGRMLWPTWTYLPKKARDLDLINATFQARGPGKPCLESWFGGDAGPPPFVWWFYSLLEHFINFGIRGSPAHLEYDDSRAGLTDKQSDREKRKYTSHTIKVLDLNCVEPAESYLDPTLRDDTGCVDREKMKSLPACVHCGMKCHKKARYFEHLLAGGFHNMLNQEIHSLLRMRATMPWGQPLYSNIGKVRFRVNGSLKSEVDLSDWLVKLPDSWENHDIAQWRKQAIRYKRGRGFTFSSDVQQHTSSTELWDEMLASEGRARV